MRAVTSELELQYSSDPKLQLKGSQPYQNTVGYCLLVLKGQTHGLGTDVRLYLVLTRSARNFKMEARIVSVDGYTMATCAPTAPIDMAQCSALYQLYHSRFGKRIFSFGGTASDGQSHRLWSIPDTVLVRLGLSQRLSVPLTRREARSLRHARVASRRFEVSLSVDGFVQVSARTARFNPTGGRSKETREGAFGRPPPEHALGEACH
jgi:hypothetical protein